MLYLNTNTVYSGTSQVTVLQKHTAKAVPKGLLALGSSGRGQTPPPELPEGLPRVLHPSFGDQRKTSIADLPA